MSWFFKCCYGGSKASGVSMDPPQQEVSILGLKENLIKKTCGLAFKAHNSSNYYHVEKNKNSSSEANLIVVSFSGSFDATDLYVSNSNKPYGVTKINHLFFPSLKSIGKDESALVNEAFQLRFESILKNSSLQQEVNQAMATGKQIVFTGHSSGAAMAILATLWTLEQFLNKNHKPPFCVTFGSPLIGNHMLSHATNRENWSQHFTHFVTRFDIVPRIFLSPISSIEPMHSSILKFLNPNSKSSTNDSEKDSVTSEFYSNVMRNASTVTNYAVSEFMDNTNILFETVSGLVELSPYRPFGNFIFCNGNGNGKFIVITNSDAVLQVLFYSAIASDLSEVSEVSKKSILQHLNYEAEFKDSLKMENIVFLDQLEELPLTADGSTISIALDCLGLNTRARLCLRAAGEWQNKKHTNEEKMKNEINEKALGSMNDLKEYKETCEANKMCYYDSFKDHKGTIDFKANVKRLVLAGVWDEIIEMLKRHELPDEFEGKKEWIDLGTMYRTLVEPLDIANYYRHFKNLDSGPYLENTRPRRYKYTQRWLEHYEGKRVVEEFYSRSCFWGEVEELCNIGIDVKNSDGSLVEGVKERVLRLENQINVWFENGELDKDVFFEGSTLVKWWKSLPQEHKRGSCIRSFIEEENM